MKIMTYGIWFHPNAYLKSAWNVLDGVTVVVGIIIVSIGDSGGDLASLRSLRTLRALRPIRMASRAPGMKVRSQPMLTAQWAFAPLPSTLPLGLLLHSAWHVTT